MSNATKCDRCGGFYEQGGKNVRQGWGTYSDEYDLCPDCAESFDAWLERGQMADTSERATEFPEMAHDTREKLEADAQKFAQVYYADHLLVYDKVIELLDRQAAITEREFFETACHGCERLGGDGGPTLDELSDELRKYRDEWKGLAEKYRADSIAAQEETERYRAKLGDVLDSIHEAERAAR